MGLRHNRSHPQGHPRPVALAWSSDLFSIIQAAGWPIWPLIACSVLGMALVIERFVSLKTRKIFPPKLLDEAIMVSRNGIPGPDVVKQLEQNSVLGTVVGMIEIFGAQAPGATGNPVQMAHGISIALYNTAFGLIVAIPALIFWRYFRARVDSYLLSMELAAERFARHLLSLRKPTL